MDLTLNNRQKKGKLIAYCNFKDGTFVNLIKLDKPYKDGTRYSVFGYSNHPFMSDGLFKNILSAFEKYNILVSNGTKTLGIRNSGLLDKIESQIYLKS